MIAPEPRYAPETIALMDLMSEWAELLAEHFASSAADLWTGRGAAVEAELRNRAATERVDRLNDLNRQIATRLDALVERSGVGA